MGINTIKQSKTLEEDLLKMINKHREIKKFVEKYLQNQKLCFENFQITPHTRAIVPEYGDFELKKDVLGNSYKVYTFTFVAVEKISNQPLIDANINNMEIMDDFNNWILEQEKNSHYPNFGDNVIEYKWELTQNMGNLAYVDEQSIAKYLLTIKLNYVEKERDSKNDI